MKKVLVSGCFDLLHTGHVAFLREASQYGRLHVRVGSDENIRLLKGNSPMFSEEERVYLLNSIDCVFEAAVSSGTGMLDFEPDISEVRPDCFVVNEDGHTEGKQRLCSRMGVKYIVLKRIPAEGLPARSSSDTKREMVLPFRACLAGGWIDQPWVSRICPGSVVTVALEPTVDFGDRSGMATSTRRVARWLWGNRLPDDDLEKAAKILFACENPPGTKYVSGSQDAIGLVYPGVNRLDYGGGYWPGRIESCWDLEVAKWLEGVLHFVPLTPRPDGYDPLSEKYLDREPIRQLGLAGLECWEGIVNRDLDTLGRSLTRTVKMWQRILPRTVNEGILAQMEEYAGHAGSNFSGCGGGFIIVASDRPVENSFKIKVRLPSS